MGRTIASITQTWQQEELELNHFKRALRAEDQALFDNLIVLSRLHLAEASYASNLYPLDIYLIAILLEVYKQFKAMQRKLNLPETTYKQSEIKEQACFVELLSHTSSLALQEYSTAGISHSQASMEILQESTDSFTYTEFEETP